MSATLSLPGPSGVMDAGARRAPPLFGSVRRNDDRGFRRRMLRLLPPVLAVHLAAVAVLLTVRPAPRALPAEPPRVVFLRALPRAAAAPAPSAPAAHPPARRARVVPHRREIRPPVVPPTEIPPEPPAEVAASPEPGPPSTGPVASSGAGGPSHGPGGIGLGSGSAPVGVGEITRAPDILFSPRPQYPAAAKAMGVTGRVLVRVVVDMAGRVEAGSARVLRSVPGLDAAALAAIVQWRFSSSVDRSGRPVRVILDIPVEFSLR